MKSLFAFTCLFSFLSSFAGETGIAIPANANTAFTINVQDSVRTNADSLSYKIIEVIDHTHGYEIYLNGRVLIHQPTIPCLKGSKGFIKKADARKVAMMVVEKIRKGVMPPTVTMQELKTAGVVF